LDYGAFAEATGRKNADMADLPEGAAGKPEEDGIARK
jgi:hypothetical protein